MINWERDSKHLFVLSPNTSVTSATYVVRDGPVNSAAIVGFRQKPRRPKTLSKPARPQRRSRRPAPPRTQRKHTGVREQTTPPKKRDIWGIFEFPYINIFLCKYAKTIANFTLVLTIVYLLIVLGQF